eukprot:gene10658-8274_t
MFGYNAGNLLSYFPALRPLAQGGEGWREYAVRRMGTAGLCLCALAAAALWGDFANFGETALWSVVILVTDCMLVARCRRRPAAAVVAMTVVYL